MTNDADAQMDEPSESDSETTLDPEMTSAADAGWLAELRASAQERQQSLADTLADDEVTVGDSEAFEQIRAAAAAARSDDTAAPAIDDEPSPPTPPEPSEPEPTVVATERVTPPSPAEPPPRPGPVPGSEAPTSTSSPAPPRWEPPPRLSTAATTQAPVLKLNEPSRSAIDWRLAVVAAAAALALGFGIASLLGGDESPADDPITSTTIAPSDEADG